ncbi:MULTISPECIES: protoporphyrinogen/coproporphyrinogen oxidase [Proteus]|uniref:NAD(P)-binding protein n=1 Tax=Proteus penneri TaxID=102862 RepID=A0ABS0W7C3_9GAMM|nr:MULTISPECIES: NAD(P)-binding protein [Proteus]MBJ2118820.1 NAD(P)-binding protein [Proteus penneri]NBM77706.1 NAD(P)-binding protein [Proteus sp. G2659]
MDIIIGAGVTGLSYANFTKNNYLIFDQSSIPGGYCKTIHQDGFVWDYSGHFFHFTDEKIKNFVFERMEHQEIKNIIKNTKIYLKNRYIDFPFQKNIHQLPKENFIKAIYELYNLSIKNSVQESKSFKEMIINNYGNEICDLFLIPYNEKLYATDLDTLDSGAMGRFFPKAKLNEIIDNFIDKNTISYNSRFIYPENGAYEYIKALLVDIPQNKLNLNEGIVSINKECKTVTTSKNRIFSYDNLISTTPLTNLFSLTSTQYDENKFTANKVKVFNLGFDKPSTNKEHWIYYPEKNIIFYRVGFYNNILSSDKMSLYVEIGSPSNDGTENQETILLNKVIEDLKKVGVITDQNLISYNYLEMNPAYVHINRDSELEKLEKMKELSTYNIYSIGRYGEWKYCSIEDNIKDAVNLANKLNKEVI